MIVALVLFWIPTLLLLWVYAGYPIVAWLAGRIRPFVVRPSVGLPGLVTIGIAAHDEADVLESRVRDVLAQATAFPIEVIVASDGSTDRSIEVLGHLAAREPRLRFLDLPWSGQTAAQNAIFDAARGEVVVLSDAETQFASGCLAALIDPFRDPRVGVTTGRLEWLDGSRTETSRNEGAYWRYEQAVRRIESRAGWLTAVTGAILAVRATVPHDVPAHASMDHLLPLRARDQGLVVLAVPGAVARDRGIAGVRDQFRNRSRTATRGIRSNLSMAGRLAPWRRPSAALAIWSHKLLRWATPWLVALAAVGGAWLGLTGAPGYLIPIGIGLTGLVLAALAWLIRSSRRRPPRITSLPLAIVVVNAAFLVGWWNVVRSRRIELWHRSEWAAARAPAEPPSLSASAVGGPVRPGEATADSRPGEDPSTARPGARRP